MGLSEYPSVPLDRPEEQVYGELKRDDDIRKIIYVAATIFSAVFLFVLIMSD
jgi:hypothetical protein